MSEKALQFIASAQEDGNTGLKDMESDLTGLLVEVIQLNFGDGQCSKFSKVLADAIDLVRNLQA